MDIDLINVLLGAGLQVLVIRDVPFPPDDPTDCIAQNPRSLGTCDGPRSARTVPDPLFDAATAAASPDVSVLDFTNAICDQTTCFDVVGGIIVYFNQGHLTRAFATSLRPYLESPVLQAMSR